MAHEIRHSDHSARRIGRAWAFGNTPSPGSDRRTSYVYGEPPLDRSLSPNASHVEEEVPLPSTL
jgi:hypothetical protein